MLIRYLEARLSFDKFPVIHLAVSHQNGSSQMSTRQSNHRTI